MAERVRTRIAPLPSKAADRSQSGGVPCIFSVTSNLLRQQRLNLRGLDLVVAASRTARQSLVKPVRAMSSAPIAHHMATPSKTNPWSNGSSSSLSLSASTPGAVRTSRAIRGAATHRRSLPATLPDHGEVLHQRRQHVQMSIRVFVQDPIHARCASAKDDGKFRNLPVRASTSEQLQPKRGKESRVGSTKYVDRSITRREVPADHGAHSQAEARRSDDSCERCEHSRECHNSKLWRDAHPDSKARA